MNEAQRQPEERQPAEHQPAEREPAPRKPWRRRFVLRLLALLVAIFAALLVTVFSVDLGPSLRGRAEREASKYLERPMHIGKLSAKLRPGEFELRDVVIEGLTPESRPFLTASKITVKFPWWIALDWQWRTGFNRRIVVESIDMTDWEMFLETFPGGRHNLPRLKPRKSPNAKPSGWKTTTNVVRASRGRLTYKDHGTPWSIDTGELSVSVRHHQEGTYLGMASFPKGTIQIQQYLPFAANMRSHFNLKGPKLHFTQLDLVTDGAVSTMDGDIDFNNWPAQIYRIKSRIDFPTQKNIFFHRDKFVVSGQGDFEGTYELFRQGGFELKGPFRSDVAGVNQWRFPDLRGHVRWLPRGRLEVTQATSRFMGGTAQFDYVLGPTKPKTPTPAVWDVAYRDVDLVAVTDFLELKGLRLAGQISGRNRFEWGLGEWSKKRGGGEVDAQAPAGVTTMTRQLTPELIAAAASLPPEIGPFNPHAPLGYVPVSGRLVYTFDPDSVSLDDSWVATPKTFVEFSGRTAFGERSRIPFHVTSLDWQESDRVLAGIMTAFGAPTGAIPVGGYGEFDGVMLNSFSRPRIEGAFSGDRMRAWDVVWGRGRADIEIENGYVVVKNATLVEGDSEIVANGQFSLGYPRRDGGEELNARVRITRRPLKDLRHAFALDDYPVDGLVSGEFHLYRHYETPHGFGRLVVDKGVAYGESFDTATSSLRFEGTGVRLDSIDIRKSTGTITGAAWVGWDGNYSFNTDGRRIPVESLAIAALPNLPLSGLMQFAASGAGTFDAPRYDVKARVDDLYVKDEGVGQVTGVLGIRNDVLTIDLEAASPRLTASGSGRIAMTPEMDASLTLRFSNTSLDPYLRLFESPERPLSPYTVAVAGGTVRAVGELADIDQLVVEVCVDTLDLKLFDYQLREKPLQPGESGSCSTPASIELALNRHIAEIRRFSLVGEGTALQLGGSLNLHDSTVDVEASGDASLGILQGFFRDIRSSGAAALLATMTGRLESPVFAGSARINNGRVRHMSLPHSLEAINGTLSFDARGIRVDDVVARLASGEVRFGGRVGLKGFVPNELNLTASGERMLIRYPEGFRSSVAADLQLVGDYRSPLLKGTITVQDSLWSRRFEVTPDLFNLRSDTVAPAGPTAGPTLPVRLDLQVNADRTLRVQNNLMNMTATADLRLQGTYDRPQLFGRAEIDRGDVVFEGNRYLITRGTLDFSNPARIEPYIDVEAETRVRAVDQTYQITLGFVGTPNNIAMSFNSDPPLPMANIFQLLLGQTADVRDAELLSINPQAAAQSEAELLRIISARLLGGPISAPVQRGLERTLGVTSVQISPSLGNETDPLAPSARLIISQRISNRAYLTFARALGTVVRDQIIILEYDQNDRIGWVLTQTGDRTFAVDFRVRHRF
jgi:TamB, inner membrane protein subunit of TAM complex